LKVILLILSESLIIRNADLIIDFNLSWWAAISLSVAVLLPVTYFCYFRLKTQNRPVRISLTLIRSVSTLCLLLLVLDATIVRTHDTGSKLVFIQVGSDLARAAWTLPYERKLDDRFRFVSGEGSIPEIERFVQASLQEEDQIAGAVIRARSPGEAAAAVEIIKRRIGAPLFVILDAASTAAPELLVISAGTDGRAILGIPRTIQVMVYGRGMAGRTTRIELRDEVRALGSAVVSWKSEYETAIVPLTFTPAVEGAHSYTVSAEPQEDEAAKENNETGFTLDVRRSARRALYMESQPTWEGKFIRRALQDNSPIRIDYFAQISREAVLAQPAERGRSRDLRGILANFNLLAQYDLIIAGPMDAAFFSTREAQNVNDFIERRGGGLIILGSNDHSGSILSPSSRLAHLSPAIVSLGDASNAGREGTTFLVPTDEGIAEGVFHSQTNGSAFEKLGPISTAYLKVGSLRPGARAFATDGSFTGPQSPVLVAGQSYGLGRTLLVAPSDSWRPMLETASDERNDFYTFWQNLAFWSAGRAEPPSYLSLAGASISESKGLTFYLTARDDAFNPLAAFAIEAEIDVTSPESEGAVERFPVIVERMADAPGIYRLSSRVFGEGAGILRARIQAPGREAETLSLEFDTGRKNLRQDGTPDLLDRLEIYAGESGGRVFGVQETDELITMLRGLPTASIPIQSAFKLRDSIALAFLLPLLLAAEYLLRRVALHKKKAP
jgi:hypothetical protein